MWFNQKKKKKKENRNRNTIRLRVKSEMKRCSQVKRIETIVKSVVGYLITCFPGFCNNNRAEKNYKRSNESVYSIMTFKLNIFTCYMILTIQFISYFPTDVT